jgi:HEAT repeat protein
MAGAAGYVQHLLIYLDAIRQRGEPNAAILLWPGILNRSAPVQQRALEVMTTLLNTASAIQVLNLIHEASRGNTIWSQADHERWWNLTPNDVRSLGLDRPDSAGLLVLLSGHHSGFVREAAVLELDGLTLPCVVPALRDRLNDWVEPVRRAALRAMRSFFSAEHAAALIGSLDLLDGLRRCGRADHQAVLDQIDMVLREPAALSQVQVGLSSHAPGIRRGCYVALLHGPAPDEWLVWGLEAKDPWIRLHAAHAIQALSPDRRPTGILDRIAVCGLRPVRQIAVEMIAENGDVDRLRIFLLDQSPTLREFARFYLDKLLGSFNAKAFYRDGLTSASGAQVARYIDGLGETGDGDDVPSVLDFIEHKRTLVRLAATRALARLAPSNLTDPFLLALADHSWRIRQTASAALAARQSELPIERLVSLATTADPEGRWCVALLLGNYPSTAQLPSLEQFLTDVDDDVRGLAENLCLRSLGQILNPFLKPDPWRTWAEQHYSAWSANHRDRVRELIKTKFRGR